MNTLASLADWVPSSNLIVYPKQKLKHKKSTFECYVNNVAYMEGMLEIAPGNIIHYFIFPLNVVPVE